MNLKQQQIKEKVQVKTEPRNTKTKGTQNGVETGPIIVKIDYGEVNVKREYKIGDEEWKQANKQIVEIEIDKNTSVVARHLDGEIAINTRTVEIKNVDNEAPKIENANAIVDKTKVTVNADIKDEASENAEQDIAGVTTTYNIDGGNYQKENIFIVEMAGEKTINIKAIDRAGNETIKEINVTTKFTTNNINGDSNKTYTGEETSPSNPVIPVGFKISNDGASWNLLSDGKTVEGWNSGLVIEDKDGNQFVWVPVDGTNVTYTKKDWAYKDVLITGLDVVKTDDFPEKVKTTWKQDEQSQITKYHGFYIARYEAGIPKDMEEEPIDKTSEGITKLRNTSGIPVSKKNQIPWGNITYTNAKTNAEMMYTGGNVQSGLLTGTMWDTTLQWLIKTNAVTESEVNNDSTKWGNHATSEIDGITSYSKNGIEWINENAKKPKSENGLNANCMWILKTGNTEYTKRNNIYDLAGNLWEWTYEIYDNDSNYHIHRSGGYQWYGSAPAGYRQRIAIDTATIQIGFRVALYINKDI